MIQIAESEWLETRRSGGNVRPHVDEHAMSILISHVIGYIMKFSLHYRYRLTAWQAVHTNVACS